MFGVFQTLLFTLSFLTRLLRVVNLITLGAILYFPMDSNGFWTFDPGIAPLDKTNVRTLWTRP